MSSLVCKIVGHKVMKKSFIKTGESYHSGVSGEYMFDEGYYTHKHYKHCLRCGEINKNYKENQC